MPDPLRPHWTVTSLVLLVIGLLILIPSGLCTGVMGIGALFGSPGMQTFPVLIMIAIVGGIPTLIGFLIVKSAFKMRRRSGVPKEKHVERLFD